MKKQLDTRVMENELRSGSAFFRAVPPGQTQGKKEQPAPPPAEGKDFDPNAAPPSLGSQVDGLPAIKPPPKEANLAPVVSPEQAQTDQPATPPPVSETPRQTATETGEQTGGYPDDAASLPSFERSFPQNEALNERTNEPSNVKRQKIRHTFDIYADQLLSLKEIQLYRARVLEKHYRLGDLVQEALDGFITKERNKE